MGRGDDRGGDDAVICILPEWLGQVLTLLTVGFGLAGGLLAFRTIDNIGARKHPRMDMKDSGHRQWWGSGGIALGLAAFVVLGIAFGTAGREIACELAGTYQPVHSFPSSRAASGAAGGLRPDPPSTSIA